MNTRTSSLFVICLAFSLACTIATARPWIAQDEADPAQNAGPLVTFEELVREMGDARAFARLPDPPYEIEIVKRGVAEDEQSEQGDGERLVASFGGPGSIVRIWSANPSGTLRVYFDGQTEPTIEVSASAFLSGDGPVPPPFAVHVGSTSILTLPLPFASQCRITCDTDADFGVTSRLYDESVSVRTFALGDLEKYERDIEATVHALRNERPAGQVGVYETAFDITTGSSMPIRPLDPEQVPDKFFPARQLAPVEFNLPEGGRAISGVTVKLYKYHPHEKRHEPLTREELVYALRFVEIGFEFDRKVYSRAPLGDFFGVGPGLYAIDDPMRKTEADGTLTSRWVMPYKKSGIVKLHNLSQSLDIWAEVKLKVIAWDWDERSLFFMPHWSPSLETEPGELLSNVTVRAKNGRLVGQSLTVMNPVSSWWGGFEATLMLGDGETLEPLDEGDLFAANADTTARYESPLVSRPRADGAAQATHLENTIFNRLMPLDAVGFESGFNVSIRASEALEGLPDFGSLLYFYVTEDYSVPTGYPSYFDQVRSLTAPPLAFKFDGAIECENVDFETYGEELAPRVRKLLPRASGRWSGSADLFVNASNLGDAIEMTIPAPNDEASTLTLFASGGDAAGVVSITVNGQVAVEKLDLSARAPIAHLGPILLGNFEPIDGRYSIRVEAVGMGENSGIPIQFRPDAKRYAFGLDCVTITSPKRDVK